MTGEADTGAECFEVSVPLRWSAPDGPQIELFLKRLPATGPVASQLWMLAGGPGSAGDGVEPAARAVQDRSPQVEILMLDHRGTGRSTRLGCSAQEAGDSAAGSTIVESEVSACVADVVAQWEGALDAFSTTQAAHDLGQMISVFGRSGLPVFVYGISYGTYLAQRYLQLYPTQPDGVILDGIVPPSTTIATSDQRMDAVGKLLLDSCAADPTCSAAVGADPRGQVESLFDELAEGHCADLGDPETVRSTLRQMMGNLLDARGYRPLIPAILVRARRCSTADQAALVHLYEAMTTPSAPPSAEPALRSTVTFLHIGLSEMWPDPPPSPIAVRAATDATEISTEISARVAALRHGWPTSPVDRWHGQWAEADVPMLLLNGALDGTTPAEYAREVALRFAAPHQYYVEIPWAPHGSLLASPLAADPTEHCALQLMLDFLADPRAAVRPRCEEAALQPIDFAGAAGLPQWAFGVPSLWE